MSALLGFRVHVTPDVPKMQLSKDVPVSPDFRKEIDAWLVEFFGYTNILGDDAILVSEAMGTIHCNPKNYARLKTQFTRPASAEGAFYGCKGHAPRKGRDDKAFSAGYDGIDLGRKVTITGWHLVNPGVPVKASDGREYIPTEEADGSVTITPVAPPTGEPVSYRFDDGPEGQKHTGWPPGMLQDDSYTLAHALSSKPDARQHVRDVAKQIEDQAANTCNSAPSD